MKQMASKNYNNAFIFAYEPLVKEGKKWKRAKTPFPSPDKYQTAFDSEKRTTCLLCKDFRETQLAVADQIPHFFA